MRSSATKHKQGTELALQGRTDAAREIANRVEGRVAEEVEVSGSTTYHSLIPHAERAITREAAAH